MEYKLQTLKIIDKIIVYVQLLVEMFWHLLQANHNLSNPQYKSMKIGIHEIYVISLTKTP